MGHVEAVSIVGIFHGWELTSIKCLVPHPPFLCYTVRILDPGFNTGLVPSRGIGLALGDHAVLYITFDISSTTD